MFRHRDITGSYQFINFNVLFGKLTECFELSLNVSYFIGSNKSEVSALDSNITLWQASEIFSAKLTAEPFSKWYQLFRQTIKNEA